MEKTVLSKDEEIRELKNMVLLLYNANKNKAIFRGFCNEYQRTVLDKCDILIQAVKDTPYPLKPTLKI